MKSVQVIIKDVETPIIEQLDEKEATFIISNWLSIGFQKKVSENEFHLYPPHKIEKIIVIESNIMVAQ